MPIQRFPKWDTHAFHSFLLSRATEPFAWGTNDCATFSGDGILANTGTDVMAALRGYTSLPEAMRKIAEVTGGGTLIDAVTWCAEQHGLVERAHPLMAQRGDLVLYRNGDDLSAGLVHLNGRDVVSPGEQGLLRIPLSLVQRAWTY